MIQPSPSTEPSAPGNSRRQFLKRAAGAIFVGSAATFGYAWRIEPHWIEIVRRPLPIGNLPATLAGKTLVQISDLHVGPIVDDKYIASALQRTSDLRPDILVVTGDYMTPAAFEEINHTIRTMQHLRPGRLATLGILGNHDYARGWQNVAAADRLADALTGQGLTMLRNSAIDVDGLMITGLDEYLSPCFRGGAAKSLTSIDHAAANLVLCHNPDALDEPVWDGYRGWTLAGHTHGGQCKLPFLFPPIIPVRNRRYTSGEIPLADGRRLYINRGLGYLHRIRFNARPEITEFTLVAA